MKSCNIPVFLRYRKGKNLETMMEDAAIRLTCLLTPADVAMGARTVRAVLPGPGCLLHEYNETQEGDPDEVIARKEEAVRYFFDCTD